MKIHFKQNNLELTKGNITDLVLRLAFPVLVGYVGIVITIIVETFYVGKLGNIQLSALTFTFPIVLIITAIALSLGEAISTLISKSRQTKLHSKNKKISTIALCLCLIISIIMTVIGLLTIRPLFSLLGADNHTLTYIIEYIQTWYLGVIFFMSSILALSIIKSLGDEKIVSTVILANFLINALLIPIFISGYSIIPEFGIKGAAISSVIANFFSYIYLMYILIIKKKLIDFSEIELTYVLTCFKIILKLGIENLLTRIILPISTLIVTIFVSRFGTEVLAGFGIAQRIDFILLIFIFAITYVIIPFINSNILVNKINRILLAVKIIFRLSFAYGIGIYVILFVFAKDISIIFTDNEKVSHIVYWFLIIAPISYGLQGVYLVSQFLLNTYKNSKYTEKIMLFKEFIIYIPLSCILSTYIGVNGFFVSYVVAFMFTTIVIKKKAMSQFKIKNELAKAS